MSLPLSRSISDLSSNDSATPRYNGKLAALHRHIATLEQERSASNQALNALLLQATALDQRLRDALAALAAERARFAQHVDAQIGRVSEENERMSARIASLQASRFWACARFLRAIRARFR
jgi:outer membrane protein TolC